MHLFLLEQQIVAPTPAGLGIIFQNLNIQGQSSLMIKEQAQKAGSPLQAESFAVQLATQVSTIVL